MKLKNVEDIYPLAPMQQGMLFHNLYDRQVGTYFEQVMLRIRGRVDAAAYERAWQLVVERHPALRAAFILEGREEPLQVVRRRVSMPLARHDWRGLTPRERDERLAAFLREDRERGFDVTSAPLMRAALIRTGEDDYRAVWSYHHVLLDGWSATLVNGEVLQAYEALSRGQTVALPPARPYRDYIAWLRKRNLKEAEGYWRGALAGVTAPTTLRGADARPRPADAAEGARPGSAVLQFRLPAATTSALQSLARGHQLTLNTFVQGAWALLLSRYSGDGDVVFGVTVSGRPPELTGVETMIGLFINTLPTRVRVRGGEPLLGWLKGLQREQVEMRRFEHSPLVEVQGWSEVPRGLPLFESFVTFESQPAADLVARGAGAAEIAGVEHAFPATGYPIAVVAAPGAELEVTFLYDEAAFDADTVGRVAAHYRALLEDMAARPHSRLRELSMLTGAERRRVLFDWNSTGEPFDLDTVISQLFEAQAARTPDAPALSFGGARLTYGQLNEHANRVARRLRGLGIGADDLVGLHVERSVEMAVGLLGIVKAGAAYLPLDPAYPAQRLAFMLEDSGSRALLTQERFAGTLPETGAAVLCLDRDAASFAAEEGDDLPPAAHPDGLAYVIYTSGSTGRPKGVAMTQRPLVNLLHWQLRRAPAPARTLQFTSLSFDVAFQEIFSTWCAGGELVLIDEESRRDPIELLRVLEAEGVERLFLPFIALLYLAEAAAREGAAPPSHLREVITAGEQLKVTRDVRAFFARAQGCTLDNQYGPTESHVVSAHMLAGDSADWPELPPIGRPIANSRLYVLDEGLEPMPVGVAGELYIGGTGLGRGYLGRPAATAERFIPDPYSAEPGARLYRTGDLTRLRADGEIEFLGRRDDQVKVRGFRIELGEIEAALSEHEGVRECAVAAREGVRGEKPLVAYIVPARARGAGPGLRLVRGEERERLLGSRQHSRLPNGMVVAGHTGIQTGGLYHEIFEEGIYLRHGIELEEGACVFDVGANIGMFSLFVSERCRRARIYAFEPLPPNFELLRANTELYGLDGVRLFECGLSNEPAVADFTFYPYAAAMSGYVSGEAADKQATRAVLLSWLEQVSPDAIDAMLPEHELDQMLEQYLKAETYRCPLRTISQVMREQGVERIDLLKLDVERSEYDVLAGIEEEDWAKIQQLVIEVHSKDLYERITALLDRHGFHYVADGSTLVESRDEDAAVRVYMLYASRRPLTDGSSNGHARPQRADTAAPSPADLRQFLAARLPEYMVPSAFVELDELPLTPSGKVDRRRLPAPEAEGGEPRADYVAPRTPAEEIVATIFADVLGLRRAGATDNFFELGGHSLSATQVVSRLRKAFNVEVTLRHVFTCPTVESLAESVEELLREGAGAEAAPVTRVERGGPLPLSFAQQRLWFMDQLEPGNPLFNLSSVLRLRGALDLEALRRTFDEIVVRHESLRTTFHIHEGQPVQHISAPAPLPLVVEEVTGDDDAARLAQVSRLARRAAEEPFDLSRGPLLRLRLARLAEDDHVLILVMHHIISDGWSMGVLVREVAALYAAFAEGGRSPLSEPTHQYADFAVWQREQLRGTLLERELSYWRERLAGAPPLLELPTDRPRAGAASYRGAVIHLEVEAELTARLRGLAREENATLFMVLLAAFKLLLARYAGQQDIVVGTDIANRTRLEAEAVIGFFVNMLVLRTDLSGEPTFRELIARVREVCLGAYAHQDVPFDRLVEELRPERSLTYAPVFQVLFVLQNAPLDDIDLRGLTISAQEYESGSTRFDLECHLWEQGEGLKGFFVYNTDLFEDETVARLIGHFETLLEAAARTPQRHAGTLPLLAPAEERQLLVGWNETATDYPRDSAVHELFERQAELTPEATALLFEEESLTYGELNRRANQLAHYLGARGVGPEVAVGVCLERSVEMVVALLAVLKAGGYYVPIDPSYPLQRRSFMLDDAQPPVLLTTEELAEQLPAFWAQVVELDAAREQIDREDTRNPQGRVAADNLAYMTYTSGSTGVPKGVAVTHRNVVRLVCNNWFASLGPAETLLQMAPLAFDASTFEVWGALLSGARLAVLAPGRASLEELSTTLERYGVTTLWLTAGLFHLMVDRHLDDLRGLRQLLAGGDTLSVRHVRRVLSELGDCQLINGYGPTESTTFACCYPVPREGFTSAHTPIGRPIANTRVYILDSRLRPAPVGVAGEFYIGGDGLARGYHNRPALTAERFIPDPFSTEPGSRLYRTGDMVRYLRNGNIEFLGRNDQQVKIRGFRVEPGEVEMALGAHPSVRECVVVAREDAPGGKRLVAYFVPRDGDTAQGAELRAYLAEQLPEYMVPSAFVELDALPLSPNGKVARERLPEPTAGAEQVGSYVAPRTPAEELLAQAWCELLGLKRVGVRDDFFELGGHSLLATQLISRLRELFGVELPLRTVFERPTVEALARAAARADSAGAPPITPAPRVGELPLSHAQQRLWFLDQLEPGQPVYNLPVAVLLQGELRKEALERALAEVVRRHEVLRTRFVSVEGRPTQVIDEQKTLSLPVVDLSALSEEAREAAVRHIAGEQARLPFDLASAPLLRVCLLRLGEREHALVAVMHHIVSDGWSLGLLVRELGALYAAFAEGGRSPLSEPTHQYADFAVWQREQLRGALLERELSYWRERLAGAPPLLELPTDRPRAGTNSSRGAVERREIEVELTARLRELARAENATLFMVLLAAFKVMLARYAGREDVIVGTPVAGRTRLETEPLLGFFVNMLVLRTDLSGEPTFRELIARVRETALGAYAHQDVPFDQLVEELQPARNLGHTPLFQVAFQLENTPKETLKVADLHMTTLEADRAATQFDLSLIALEEGGRLVLAAEYSTDLFDAETIRQMFDSYELLLKAAPEASIARLPLLSEASRRRMLSEWNETAAEYAGPQLLHGMFEQQAAETPDAVAVVSEGGQLTYAEVDRRAGALARRLRGLGAGADSLVGVLMERSAEVAVTLLGILKAGAAYLPLDPEYPDERLAFMLEDSGARLVVADGQSRERLSGLAAPGTLTVVEAASNAAVEEFSSADFAPGATPDDLCYVIYTSGSTGRPKGAMLSHRGVVNCLRWMQETYRLGRSDAFLFHTPLGFDPSVWELFWTLGTGARVVVLPPGPFDPSALVETVERQRVTTLYVVPSMLRVLLDDAAAARLRGRLRSIICGGESLPEELARRCVELTGAELHHSYGPTETSIAATEELWRGGEGRSRVPIGRPLANTRFYLLDAQMQPVPRGAFAELYIGGACVGRGYLNRVALTAERFIPDPFSTEPGSRLYRTGDRVRFLADGRVEFGGRVDAQLKVRGHRIEPGEVEAALNTHPGVKESALVARGEDGDGRLAAYVVAEHGHAPGARELRSYLFERLPEYMVPASFTFLEQLPLMPNGKVNRRELPEPSAPDAAAGDPYDAPRTPAEELLAQVWCELLGVERVGVRDNFFELGGHSLLATRFVSRVRSAFGVELPLRRLFESPTVEQLAWCVEEALREQRGADAPPLARVARGGMLPLSYAQQRLWFIHQLEEAGAAYHLPTVFRVKGQLNIDALAATFNEIARRHEMLRTTFRATEEGAMQVVSPAATLPLPVIDLRALPVETRVTEARRLADVETQRPFDLEAGPLVRACVLRLAEEEFLLTITMHHIVSDGWSVGVLEREVAALYPAFLAGTPSPLEELPVQYADFAIWQREYLRGEVLEAHLDYWRRQLGGLAPLELPTDRPRPQVQSFRGSSLSFELSPGVTGALRQLGRREGATLFMTLLGAFKLLLARYAGQEDVVVGTPIANRTRREVEPLVGFFVNTLALRTDLSGDPSFAELLGRVREATLEAYTHQDVPFDKLVEELQPARDPGRNPIFQVMFALQNAPARALELPGVSLDPQVFDPGVTRFDLECHLWEQGAGLGGVLVYSADLFEEATIRRMLRQFEKILEGVTASPAARVGSLSWAGQDEQEQLAAWNDTAREFPRDACVQHLFERQAELTPKAEALVYQSERLTYRELNERANRLAHRLRRLGVGPDSVVGVMLGRSIEMMVGVLAVLKAGGAYLPLDPEYPRERLSFMLEDAGAGVLLTGRRALGEMPDCPVVLFLEEERESLARESAENPRPEASAENLCYVIYTSGSTGRPKGVAMPHRPLVNLISFQVERSSASGAGRPHTLQYASLSFDVSFQETFSTWAAGAALVLVDDEVRRDARALLGVLRAERVERLFLPFVALQQLAEAVETEGEAPAELTQVFVAGEQLKVTRSVRGLFARLPGCTLDNHYGPTEAHLVAAHTLDGAAADWPELPPIGRPISNTQLYVLDAQLRPSPVGVPGELYIGGACLARGYYDRPALTAERFVPHPFAPGPGARLYKTGDRARFRDDGRIEFLGRADSQVKIRGFRVEPGEIEAALRELPGVRDALVVARQGPGHGLRLVAYVLVHAEACVTRGGLRELLKGKVPEYMTPSVFVLLDEFPLTPSGKVNRRALPEPSAADFEVGDSYVAPRTPAEELLAQAWCELLGLKRVGVRDNFFELGGHSLLATQLMSRVRQRLGADLPLRRLFEEPTVEGLARVVEGGAAAGLAAPPLGRADRMLPLPLSYAQQRLWFIHQLEPASAAYNLPGALRLMGALDPRALGRSLDEIVGRHEVLRTSFRNEGGRATQLVGPPVPVHLPVIDLSRLPEAAREAESLRLAREEARRGFDLETGPTVRAALLRLGREEHILLFTMHHVVSDGWSLGIMTRELAALYEAYARGAASPLEALPIQYADFAAWQREHFTGEALAGHLEYWRRRLAGAPPALELPVDCPRPAVPSGRGATCTARLSERLVEDLTKLSRREGATLFMTLLAAFDVLLARHASQKDFVVGTPIAGRTRAELEPLIGCFVNMLPLRADLSGDPTFRELLGRVRETALDAYAHQDAPFEMVVEVVQPDRDTGRTPLFQVVFALHQEANSELSLPGLTLRPLESDQGATGFDLSLHLWEGSGGLDCVLSYSTDLFEHATAARLLEHFARLLEGVASDPDGRVYELPLLTEVEYDRLTVGWHGPRADYPRGAGIHELFEQQAARTPEAEALVYQSERLTYRELNERANRLAHYLRGLGAATETCVGVLLERSPEMVVALLGVLKAGAAYVPLDPDYPAERLAFMLEDSRAGVLLTQGALLERSGWLKPGSALAVCLDADWPVIAGESGTDPRAGVTPENLAYVIYTSGSTGRPKGVAITHRSAAAFLHWARAAFTGEELSGVLASTSICFDLSVFELFAPLAWGGRVILARDALALRELGEAAGEVTLVNTVPSAMAELVRADALPRSVLTVNLAGEPLTRSLADGVHASAGADGVRLLNLYGPSEDTTYSTWAEVGHGGRAPNIGRPVANTRAYVLGASMSLVAAGVAGELYLGGEGLARGYLNRPALTAERFVPDPYSVEPGARLYRTGDVVRWSAAGELEYVGRLDNQVKVRGFRIELGEIEAALLELPEVRDCVVVAREDTPGDRRLVAYVVGPAEGAGVAGLRQALRRNLPGHMVPSLFVPLAELPLTPNGKIDRSALPAPAGARPDSGGGFVAPRTQVEELLAEVFATVLGVERAGAGDNFFELGGHSLLATQVVSRVRELFGVELPLRRLFETPTVAGLAAGVETALREGGGAGAGTPVTPAPRGGMLPLSYAQQRLWFMEQFEPGLPVYNIPTALRLTGDLDAEALAESIARVVGRHETLRTTFTAREGEPTQLVHDLLPVTLHVEDVRALPAAEREEEVRRRARVSLPFDLEAGPLVRAALYRLDEADYVLLFVMHHLISDGWSLGVLVRELAAFYEEARRGRPAMLPELPVQYADFAVWQREHLQGEVLESHLSYWRRQLDGLAPLELPTDFPRAPRQTYDGAYVTFELPDELTQALKALSRREGATLFMTLLAAFQTLLHRHSGQADFAVGADVANRNRAETEGLIGFFVNMLVMRARFDDDPTFRELLRRTREAALEAYAHQDAPFEKLVEQLQPERSLSHTPLFQVVFVLHNQPVPVVETSGLTLAPFEIDTGAVQFDLLLSVVETGRGLSCAVGYKTDLFTAETVRRWVGHYRTLLAEIVREPEQRISELRLLSEAETGGFSPESFPDAGLSQKEFENLLLEIGGLSKE